MEYMHELYIFSTNILILLDVVVWVCNKLGSIQTPDGYRLFECCLFCCFSFVTVKMKKQWRRM